MTTKNGKAKPAAAKTAKPAKAKKGVVATIMSTLAKEPDMTKAQLVERLVKTGFKPSSAVSVFYYAGRAMTKALSDAGRLKA